MLRTLVKTGVAAALHWTGADSVIGSIARPKGVPLVLAYHSVVESVSSHVGRAILPNLISVEMLERQLDWIGQRYRFVSLDELGRLMESGGQPACPVAAVTFDDGYVGVFHHAVPLLRRKGIPAGMFIITEATGRPHLQLYDKLYLILEQVLPALGGSEERFRALLKSKGVTLEVSVPRPLDAFGTMRRLFTTLTQKKLRRVVEALETFAGVDDRDYPDLQVLTWDMLQAMAAWGFTIGSHTQTHMLLTSENSERVANQLKGSLVTLQDKLNRRVEHFAYPDGRFNPAVVAAVAEAGYRFGYGTCLHRDAHRPWLTIPRKLMWERTCVDGAGRFSATLMSCHAHRLFDLYADCGHDHREPDCRAAGAKKDPADSQDHQRAQVTRVSGTVDV